MPEVTRSARRGSRANTSSVNGVRSRIATTISRSPIASARSSVVAKCCANALTSTAPARPDQSAADSATSW